MAWHLVAAAMQSISFDGIQQRVDLDDNGDAILPFSVMNYVASTQTKGSMQSVEVGRYVSGQLELHLQIWWPGSTRKTPLDHVPGTLTAPLPV